MICPPFGYEATCAYRTLRRLAERLADAGNLVLRFDYEGTGASSGTGLESDLLGRWQASVAEAVGELRRRGIPRPSLVGLRLGAALACAATRVDDDLGPLVLWAPVTSGRRFYREIRGLAAITPGGISTEGALNAVGNLVTRSTAQSLKAWNPLDGASRSEVLVVQSRGWRDAPDAKADMANAGMSPTVIEEDGIQEVLECTAEEARVPERILDAICDWLEGRAVQAGEDGPPQALENRRVRTFDDGEGPVREEIVTTPVHGLYGVLTGPPGPSVHGVAVFLNNGVAPAAGPARAWVEFARSLAARDIASFRFDFSGLGDSPDRPGGPRRQGKPVSPSAGPELLAVADYLRSRGFRIVMAVGLCSGAQIAIRTAAYRGSLDGVFAINGQLSDQPDIGIGPWMRRLWNLTAFPMGKVPFWHAVCRIPESVWRLLDRLWLFPSPSRILGMAAARGTQVQLVYAEGDSALQDIEARDRRVATRLVDSGQISMTVVEGMDHSMFDRRHRGSLLEMLVEQSQIRSPMHDLQRSS